MTIFPTACQKYLTDPSSNVNSQFTAERTRSVTRRLQQHLGDVEMHQVTEKHLTEWLGTLNVAASSLHVYIATLSALFSWAEWKGIVTVDPTRHLKRYFPQKPKPVREHHWLDQASIGDVLALPDTSTPAGLRDAVILRLGFTAGLRRSEIVTLDWSGIDWKGRTATLVGKGDKLAQVALNEATVRILTEWWELSGRRTHGPVVAPFQRRMNFTTGEETIVIRWDRALSRNQVGKIVSRYSKEAGVDFTPHDMRRSFAGIVHDKVGLEGTSAALRHSNIGTTQRYLEKRQDAAVQAVRKAGVEL